MIKIILAFCAYTDTKVELRNKHTGFDIREENSTMNALEMRTVKQKMMG
jgi:hypothetical protein